MQERIGPERIGHRRNGSYVMLAIFATVLVAGCMPKMTVTQIKAIQPARPWQLDRLEMLLGRWTTTGEVTMSVLDSVLKTRGTNEASWSMDRRMLIDHAELEMGELGRLTGMSVWTWDPTRKKYRMWWFDSFGETSEANVTYNEATETWHMSGTGQEWGNNTRGKGTRPRSRRRAWPRSA